jgi:hypothetical protein
MIFVSCLIVGPEQLKDREYLGTIQQCKLNADYAAVSFEGKVNLHMVRAHKQRLRLILSALFSDDSI